MRYAIVKDGVVINVALWDGKSEWDPGEGCHPVQSDTANIGDTYDGKDFIPVPVAEEPAS